MRQAGEKAVPTYAGNEIVECIFAVRAVNGTTAVSHGLITIDSTTIPPKIKSDVSNVQPGIISVMGYGTVVQDYYPHPRTSLARTQEREWQQSVADKTHDEQVISYVAHLVQWTIEGGVPEIGGQVDEAILNADGASWVHRKSNCVLDSGRGGRDTL